MTKRAVPYYHSWMEELRPVRNNSEGYNPCKDGHSDDRAQVTDWMNFSYEVCIRCGKSPGVVLTGRKRRARILP